MHELQQRRNAFVEGNAGFKQKPLHLWGKFFEESREAVGAFISYVRRPDHFTRKHLGEELADVVHIVMDMATYSGIDLGDAMEMKLRRDEYRFPPNTVPDRASYRRRKRELGER